MAFILPDLGYVFCMSKFCLRYSYIALSIMPVIAILYFGVRKNFVHFADKSEQVSYEREKKNQRILFFIIRSLMLALLLIAIAEPFLLETKSVKGNPRITILVDNSSSMNLFEIELKELVNKLKGTIPVAVRHIASGDKSAIGNGILNNLERDENVLVISDGNSNDGKLLGDIMLLASSLNATVSTLSMEAVKSDVGVEIIGPAEAIRDTEEVFIVNVNNLGDVPYTLEVKFGNEIVVAKTDDKSGKFTFKKRLSEGYHRITAELLNVGSNDYFKENNRYYKTVKVVPRPRVLFVSEKGSPLTAELNKIYDLTTVSNVPDNLNSYLAVILNDVPANKFLPYLDALSSYVSDGNGLFVIGGQNAYDRSSYKGSLIETLLPVKVGSGEEAEKSDVYIVIVIDVSGTTGRVYNVNTGQYEIRDYDQIIKSQAVSVIDSLDDKNNAGVIVIGLKQVGTIATLSDIVTLKDAKKSIIDKISRIDRNKVGGQTEIKLGVNKANQMLRNVAGGKNIILLSDGRGLSEAPKEEVKEAVEQANTRGIKTYVVGVGASDEQDHSFLSDLALMGEGIYFPVDASNKLKIIFGEPEDDDKEFLNKLVLLDTTHFVTFNQSLDAVVSGYNYVIPKPSARLLVTTNKNIPIMVAWRFGLGRVISFATDDGGKWSAEMLAYENSKVLTKAINWVIGDLTRERNFDVNIRDTGLGNTMLINVISDTLPYHEKLSFVKNDVNLYTAEFNPAREGFYNFLGADAAVNYKEEFNDLGINEEFIRLVAETQGKVFDKDDAEGILEFVREKSKRIKVDTTEFKWPFLSAVLILLLAEIGLRRIWENRSYKQ